MRGVRLGRTEAQVSVVSLGAWAYGGSRRVGGRDVGWTGHDDATARRALRAAYEGGINHWDTADVYGDGASEALIGSLWSELPRGEVFLATKVGWDRGRYERDYHPTLIRERIERSLRLLRTDHVDLYYLHHCGFGPGDVWLDDALEVLGRAREAGKIRFIGLSDWDASKVARLAPRVDPDVVQVYRNVTHDTYASSGLKAWVDEHDAGVAFFSPLRHGLLLGKYLAPVTFPEGDFRRSDPAFSDAAILSRLAQRRRRLEVEFADLERPALGALLGALVHDAPTGCVLLGQRTPEQARAGAAAGVALDAERAARVWALYADLRAT